ncbi:hypothetical protein NMG60_11019771 [Bertholletia excelsa]
MPRALELFSSRRSRVGRNSHDLGLDSPPVRESHHQNRNRHHYSTISGIDTARRLRRDLYGCDLLRHSAPTRHPSYRSSQPEHDAVGLNEGSSESSSGNIPSSGSRQTFSGNDRLPGAVLLARERLLERLRGASLSGNRHVDRTLSGINHHHYGESFGDEFSLIDARDWETEIPRDWLATSSLFSLSQTGQRLAPPEVKKRPLGLTQEARDSLPVEIFSNEVETSTLWSQDCSICLESFVEGDELLCLPCGHRFHSDCLDPWLLTCGDCPYCRRGVDVTQKHCRE